MADAALPRNLVEAIRYFSDPNRAFDFVVKMRWADGRVTCPRYRHDGVSFLTTRRIWKCKGCRRQFSVKVGTISRTPRSGSTNGYPRSG